MIRGVTAKKLWLRGGPWLPVAAMCWSIWIWIGSTVWAAPPKPREGGNERPSNDSAGQLPPPPGDEGGEAGDTDGNPELLTEEEQEALLEREFQQHLLDAQIAADRERFDEAEREYTAALRLQAGDPAALLGRAYARKAKTSEGRCPRGAIRDLLALETYDPRGMWMQQRSVAIEWMGLCGASLEGRRLELARELAAEKHGAPGRPGEIRVLVARLLLRSILPEMTADEVAAVRGAALEELERYREEIDASSEIPSASGLRMQADIYRELEKLERAAETYDELIRLHPHTEQASDALSIREELGLELELRRLDATQGWRPTEEAEAAYNRGMAALRRGQLQIAESELSWAIEDSPWFPRAYHARGIARARTGRFLPAVEDLKRAVWMDRSDYRAHMTLGLIYQKEFAGAEDEQAIKHLSAALRLRPDLHRLHLLLGELYARTDRETAREHYERFLRLAAFDDPDAKKARKALEELEREIRQDEPPLITPPTEESLRNLDPELQRIINEAYLRGTEQQDWDMAEKILMEARSEFPEEPVVFNELARVAYHQGRLGDARRFWDESLSMLEEQVEVHERLGLLLREDLPDKASSHLERAADLGSLTARYVLADLLWEQTRPWAASEQLDLYLAQASDYDLYWERAQDLRKEIDRRFLQFYLVVGVFSSILVLVPSWRLYRNYRGSSLRQLLEREPKSFPEVARIVSLIRHEILKHNTAFLADVGRALEVDAPDAEHRVEVLSRRLFGEHERADGRGGAQGSGGEGPAGIYGRFLGYVEELESVARAHRVTLNLYRKDPIFRPMIRAFEELARRAPGLRNPHRLGSRKKLELAKVLETSGDVLGRGAFERLSELIRELCVTNVDAELVAAVHDRVAGEKQFVGRPLAPLQITGVGAPVRIFRTDLEDILANVFRNSLRSSLLYARPPVGLGVELVNELDEITGLGSLAIRIKDRSPEQLSNEMLRGRYVERGMGITVDLLSRYDGSIGVEPEPGWAKAVVLRFFILEDDNLGEAEAA